MESTSASEQPFTRPRYFHGQLLGVDDFTAEQDYQIGKRRLHHRALHGSGVVHGLEVEAGTGAQVLVQPGLAIDPQGREIVVPEAVVVDLDAWTGTGAPGGTNPVLCLSYREEAVQPVVTQGVEGVEHTRITERFALTVEMAEAPRPESCVLLATITLSNGTVGVDSATHRRRLATVEDLIELVHALSRRVDQLERAVRSG